MEIELQNSLSQLTGQVAELAKQTKALDTSLAGALDRGSKSAGGMTDRARGVRQELSLIEQVSHRVGKAWASQVLSLTTGAIGVASVVDMISTSLAAAQQRTENSIKTTTDFTKGTRVAGAPGAALPAIRAAMRGTARSLSPDEQVAALRAFTSGGGTNTPDEVRGLGTAVNAASLLGFDPAAFSKQYGALRKLGVANPEDVILSMTQEGKGGDIDGLKAGAARARGRTSAGAWKRGLAEARNLAPEDFLEWSNRNLSAIAEGKGLNTGNLTRENQRLVEAARKAGASPDEVKAFTVLSASAVAAGNVTTMSPQERDRRRRLELERRAGPLSPGFTTGPFGISTGIGGMQQLGRAFPGMTLQEIEAAVDAGIATPAALQGVAPAPVPEAAPSAPARGPRVLPTPWADTIPRATAPDSNRKPVAEVRIVGDSRPVPINAGD